MLIQSPVFGSVQQLRHDMTSLNRRSIVLAATVLLTITLSSIYVSAYYEWNARTYRIGAAEDKGSQNTLCLPVAIYITPSALLQMHTADTIARTKRGLPKVIHQSWQTLDVPIRFKHWSDSFRLRHPDWLWVSAAATMAYEQVLWTDEDNAELVQSLFPHLEETYQSLRTGIQRADFVRNLYMWQFGG